MRVVGPSTTRLHHATTSIPNPINIHLCLALSQSVRSYDRIQPHPKNVLAPTPRLITCFKLCRQLCDCHAHQIDSSLPKRSMALPANMSQLNARDQSFRPPTPSQT
eukprot:4239744-Prymnesium_polylepis.1